MILIRSIMSFLKRRTEKKALSLVKSHQNEIHINGKGTVLTRNTILGKNPNFNGLIIRGRGQVVFGDNFHSGANCVIITDFHNYRGGGQFLMTTL